MADKEWICVECEQEYFWDVCPCDNCGSLKVISKSVYNALKEE